jgi:hypothetical protein
LLKENFFYHILGYCTNWLMLRGNVHPFRPGEVASWRILPNRGIFLVKCRLDPFAKNVGKFETIHRPEHGSTGSAGKYIQDIVLGRRLKNEH